MKLKRLTLPSISNVTDIACQKIITVASLAIQQRGKFKIVLAGGTTPEKIYNMLSKEACDWNNWVVFIGDERCLAPDSEERNSQMAMKSLLSNIDIPSENIHFIPAELGAQKAAKIYDGVIQDHMPFDLVLLGMGEDGHTASLFPGHLFKENETVHAVNNAPKPPSDRVSLSASSLSNSEHVLIIITGKNKRTSVEAWDNGELLPIAEISSLNTLTVILDEDGSPF